MRRSLFVILYLSIFATVFFQGSETVLANQDFDKAEAPVVANLLVKLRMAPLGRAEVPDFSLDDLSGRKVRLSDFRGKVVLMNFWTTW